MRDHLVVIPIYNEERSVGAVLRAVLEGGAGVDVLCVNDGSTDGTRRILAGFDSIALISRPQNEGYGRALVEGFRWAVDHGYRTVTTLDCDEQHEPALIPVFIRELERGGHDIVSGSRYLAPEVREGPPPADRLRVNQLITEEINALTGYGLTDAFCGFKTYRVEPLARIEPYLTEKGYAFPLQLWVVARALGLKVAERPVPLIYKPNFERRFGGPLDDTETRLAYYRSVIRQTLDRMRQAEFALPGAGAPVPLKERGNGEGVGAKTDAPVRRRP